MDDLTSLFVKSSFVETSLDCKKETDIFKKNHGFLKMLKKMKTRRYQSYMEKTKQNRFVFIMKKRILNSIDSQNNRMIIEIDFNGDNYTDPTPELSDTLLTAKEYLKNAVTTVNMHKKCDYSLDYYDIVESIVNS
jgi:hypothetical protein